MRQNINGVIGEIDSLPGCTQIAISHSVFLTPGLRGNGYGHSSNVARQQVVFNELGYDMMICTIDASNIVQRKILEKSEWSCLTSFKSTKTGHTVELWSVQPG